MEQIEPGHIVIFTVDLAVNQPDYHLTGCADDRAVEVSAEHLSPLIARTQSADGSKIRRSSCRSVPVSDTISKLPLKSFA